MIMLDINTKNRATTQFTGLDYNSMAKFAGKYIAASSQGIHVIEGSTDDGADIDAWLKSGMIDFGLNNRKRMRFFYFGLETTGDLKITITADEKTAVVYDVKGTPDGSQQRIRIPVGRNISGRYWSWKIENVNGCDFSLDSVQCLPVIMHQGHRTR